jgi:hypothetical protein
MNINELTEVIKSSSNVFVVKLLEKDGFNEDEFSKILDSLRTESITRGRNKVYNQWLNSEKDNLDVIDLRSKIF